MKRFAYFLVGLNIALAFFAAYHGLRGSSWMFFGIAAVNLVCAQGLEEIER